MLCRLHTVYKIIHCVALHTLCDITQRVSNLYTVSSFRVQSGQNYTGQKEFTQAPPVVPVTNIGYGVFILIYMYSLCKWILKAICGGCFGMDISFILLCEKSHIFLFSALFKAGNRNINLNLLH